MLAHARNECGKDPNFQCPYCPHRTKQRGNLKMHIMSKHIDKKNNWADNKIPPSFL